MWDETRSRILYRSRKILRRVLNGASRITRSRRRRTGGLLYERKLPDAEWVFHDERWERVVHRFQHRRMVQAGVPFDVDDTAQRFTEEIRYEDGNTLVFDGRAASKDEWFYLYLDPVHHRWTDYVWRFKVRRDTDFRELQFGFRYQDFYNRYRYRFERGSVFFDKVCMGRFYNSLGRTAFVMEQGKWDEHCGRVG